MLSPDNRRVLLEALRPPVGYTVDRAIATTFSLDLIALLTAPVAFSLFDGMLPSKKDAETDESVGIDPFALLKAVRLHADRMTVFCQVGKIGSPRRYQRLLTYLEKSVVQVRSPTRGGVFHPKVWVVRYASEDGPVRYRVLCSSRNLTFDQSWDTLVALDGELTDRTNAIARNRPLADFVGALPGLAIAKMKDAAPVELIADELRRTRFELPEGFDDLQFHPVGIENYRKNPIAGDFKRLLIVSPFVTEGALETHASNAETCALVSRMDELHKLPAKALEDFESVHVLQDAAEQLDGDDAVLPETTELRPPLSGLHAKLFVADHGWDSSVWTGSLNATSAALKLNVEFMVQLTGKRSLVGVEAFLGEKKGEGLAPLLAPYTLPAESVLPDPVEQRLEERLRVVRDQLSDVAWLASIGAESGSKTFDVLLRARGEVEFDGTVKVTCWPIAVPETFAQSVNRGTAGEVARFPSLSFEAVTGFFAFRAVAAEGEVERDEVFVLNVPLEGAPQDREARLLQSLLDDPEKVLRFLRMLLASDPLEVLDAFEPSAPGEGSSAGVDRRRSEPPLLESLVQAVARDPGRIDAVEQFVNDLSSTEEGRRALPPDFLAVWEPIRSARVAMKGAAK